jgi:catechol 2,3-dioxygenase-like lactoylglutathione lyase family enzyme
MHQIAHIALIVRDYDEAIAFYTEVLDFVLIEDTKIDEHKRWVIVAPKGARECSLILAKAANDIQAASIGNQSGGRVFLFLFTDSIERDVEKWKSKGVEFVRLPSESEYGIAAVFKDLYGNLWDLIQPSTFNKGLLSRND